MAFRDTFLKHIWVGRHWMCCATWQSCSQPRVERSSCSSLLCALAAVMAKTIFLFADSYVDDAEGKIAFLFWAMVIMECWQEFKNKSKSFKSMSHINTIWKAKFIDSCGGSICFALYPFSFRNGILVGFKAQ